MLHIDVGYSWYVHWVGPSSSTCYEKHAMEKTNRELHLFRMKDGAKTPVIITIDSERTILSEREAPAANNPVIRAATRDKPGGGKEVTAIHASEQEMLRFFTPNYKCESEDCQKLLDEYRARVEAAKKANCKQCELGALIREYAPKVRELLGL